MLRANFETGASPAIGGWEATPSVLIVGRKMPVYVLRFVDGIYLFYFLFTLRS
jgi:hypothetical protein